MSRQKPRRNVTRAIIVNKDNKVLITRRDLNDVEGGKWCLPGGKVDEGETKEQCIKKELQEEVGVEIEIESHFLNWTQENETIWISDFYICIITSEIKFEPNDEVSEIAFIDMDQLDSFKFAFAHEDIIEKFFRNKRQ